MCKEKYNTNDERKTWCWMCKSAEMIWQADFSFEDFDIEEEGVISTLICPVCNTTAEFHTKI